MARWLCHEIRLVLCRCVHIRFERFGKIKELNHFNLVKEYGHSLCHKQVGVNSYCVKSCHLKALFTETLMILFHVELLFHKLMGSCR